MPTEPDQKIKVIVTDDMSLFRTGVINSLAKKDDITIIGEAVNGQDLFQKLEYLQPDIIILNIQMPVLDGLDTLPILKKKYPAIKVIILSFLNQPEIICHMVKLGANAYVTKESGSEEIYEAILGCHKNWFFINDTVRNAMANIKFEISQKPPYTYSQCKRIKNIETFT
jgi:DNA-binding NarL/FixJ family response regulator